MKPEQIKELLIRISRKEEGAFNMLFDHYYPKLIQVAMFFVPSLEAAQEVVSDLFYKLLKNPRTLKKVKDFDSYIFLCVKNQSKTYLGKNRNKSFFDSINLKDDYFLTEFKNPENSFISNELLQLVEKAIQNLPPRRRAVFLLVKDTGKKYREVADLLDISVKTVELHMSYALKTLREVVTKYQESRDIRIHL